MKQDEEKLKELREKIESDLDYINSRKHKFSLKEYRKKHSAPAPDNVIAYFLCTTPEQVQQIYASAVKKIRQSMKIDL